MDAKNSGFWSRSIGISSVICGFAFAVAAFLYSAIQPLNRFLFAFYMGYLLTAAKGPELKKIYSYSLSLLSGFVWIIPYWFSTEWLTASGIKSVILARAVAELILNTALVYIHQHILRKTGASILPFVFASICSVFASGGIQNWTYCALSLFFGMISCMLVTVIADKLVVNTKNE